MAFQKRTTFANLSGNSKQDSKSQAMTLNRDFTLVNWNSAKDLLLWQLLKPYAHRFSLAFWNLGLWACCSHRSRKRTKLQVAPPGLVQRYNPNTKLQSSWNNFNPAFQTTLPLINILRHLSVDAQKTPGFKKNQTRALNSHELQTSSESSSADVSSSAIEEWLQHRHLKRRWTSVNTLVVLHLCILSTPISLSPQQCGLATMMTPFEHVLIGTNAQFSGGYLWETEFMVSVVESTFFAKNIELQKNNQKVNVDQSLHHDRTH